MFIVGPRLCLLWAHAKEQLFSRCLPLICHELSTPLNGIVGLSSLCNLPEGRPFSKVPDLPSVSWSALLTSPNCSKCALPFSPFMVGVSLSKVHGKYLVPFKDGVGHKIVYPPVCGSLGMVDVKPGQWTKLPQKAILLKVFDTINEH